MRHVEVKTSKNSQKKEKNHLYILSFFLQHYLHVTRILEIMKSISVGDDAYNSSIHTKAGERFCITSHRARTTRSNITVPPPSPFLNLGPFDLQTHSYNALYICRCVYKFSHFRRCRTEAVFSRFSI